MGEYNWLTFGEMDEMSQWFGRGLREIGHQPKENIVIFSETRYEWLVSAVGAFRQNVAVCTLYATLGDDAVVHGINETEVCVLNPLVLDGAIMIASAIPV